MSNMTDHRHDAWLCSLRLHAMAYIPGRHICDRHWSKLGEIIWGLVGPRQVSFCRSLSVANSPKL